MPFFRVDDGLHAHKKIARLGREEFDAIALWTIAGSWSAHQLQDGWVPEYVAARLDPDYERRAKSLVRVGLWEEGERDGERGWQFHGWSDAGRNPTSEQVTKEREATAERQRRFRERMKGTAKPKGTSPGRDGAEIPDDDDDRNAVTRPLVTPPFPFPSSPLHGDKDFSSPPAAPDGDAAPPPKAKGKPKKPEPYREDVDKICRLLVDLMVDNECKPPTVTDDWRAEARRMFDIDKRPFDKAVALLEWSQRNHFWKKNIHSIPTFRAKYDQLRLDANEDWSKKRAQDHAAEEAHAKRPDWCGKCNERTRMLDDSDLPERCPRCHPTSQKANTP